MIHAMEINKPGRGLGSLGVGNEMLECQRKIGVEAENAAAGAIAREGQERRTESTGSTHERLMGQGKNLELR